MVMIQNSFRLIAFDYDGTLVSGLERISRRTRQALMLAHQKGAILTLVTGRPLAMIPPELFSLPFSYAITANGARTDDLIAKKNQALYPIDRKQVLDLLEEFAGKGISLTVFIDGKAYSDKRILGMRQGRKAGTLWQKLNWLRQFIADYSIVKDVRETVLEKQKPVEKIILNFDDCDKCGKVLSHLQSLGEVEAVTTMGFDIEITKKGTCKGRALSAVRESLEIPAEQVLAFGDSGNDLSMLDVVGCFIAPANATEDVLEKAHRVTRSSKENGVAIALEEIFAA